MSVTSTEMPTANLGDLFAWTRTAAGDWRVRTPFYYPDGELVDVYVVESPNHTEVTDHGEALGWLRTQSISGKRSAKQNRLVADVCMTQGVELDRGSLTRKCTDAAATRDAIVRVGLAAVRVTDLWFTMRPRSVESVADEVVDLLTEEAFDFDQGVRLNGRSGRLWTLDIQARTPARTSLVALLATGSVAAAHRLAEHTVAAWYDLSHLREAQPRLSFLSLVDDTSDVWNEEDFRLVESLSDVRRWSRPDEVVDYLRRAA